MNKLSRAKIGKYPHVAFAPYMRFGSPTINNTQTAVETIIKRWWCATETLELMLEDFSITRGDLLVACWYMGIYGTGVWKRRWGQWAKDNSADLWHSRFDTIELPPQYERAL